MLFNNHVVYKHRDSRIYKLLVKLKSLLENDFKRTQLKDFSNCTIESNRGYNSVFQKKKLLQSHTKWTKEGIPLK